MRKFYIVNKENIVGSIPFGPRLIIENDVLFSFYTDGETFFVSNRMCQGVHGRYSETANLLFCEIEEPVFYT